MESDIPAQGVTVDTLYVLTQRLTNKRMIHRNMFHSLMLFAVKGFQNRRILISISELTLVRITTVPLADVGIIDRHLQGRINWFDI